MNVEIHGVDPRCLVTKKIVPPAPLPHVSRRKLKLVKHRILPPTFCHVCDKAGVELRNNSYVYRGKSYGKWPYVYVCPHCWAYVGLHPDTDLPLGTMADLATREARKAAKAPFTCIVRNVYKNDRNKAYAWLSEATGIEPKRCHFALMDEDTAYQIADVCNGVLMEGVN